MTRPAGQAAPDQGLAALMGAGLGGAALDRAGTAAGVEVARQLRPVALAAMGAIVVASFAVGYAALAKR